MRSSMENKQMNFHIENRNKVLLELQKIYTKNSYHCTSNLDSPTYNLPGTEGESCSDIIEDLLTEMKRRKFKRFDEKNDENCYRCKHFLNIPENLVETSEEISDCTKEYEDDLTFVQAVVWLKSATMCMKDISIKQFHSAFHKLWDNNKEKRKDFDCRNEDSVFEVDDSESINSTIPFDTNEERNIISDSETEYTSSIDLLNNVKHNKNNVLTSDYEQYTQRDNEDFDPKKSCLSIFASQSSKRCSSSSMQNVRALNDCVIADSQRGDTSNSDIFKDSLDNQEIVNTLQNEEDSKSLKENNSVSEEFIEVLSLTSQSSHLLRKTPLEAENDASIKSNEDDLSDATIFDEDFSVHGQSVGRLKNDEYKQDLHSNTQIITDCTQVFDSNFSNTNFAVSIDHIDITNSPPKDSAYDTYPLSDERCSFLNENADIFSSQKIDDVPYQKNHCSSDIDHLEFLTIDMAAKSWILNKNQQSCTPPSKLSLDNENNGNPKCKRSFGEKRKFECIREMDCLSTEDKKKTERKVSSRLLRFTLHALNTNDIAFESVKVILSIFQDERIARQYMRKRCWKDTLEAKAVHAILDFCDVFEAESKTNTCTQEIVRTVTDTLDRSIGNIELDKATILVHQLSITLELCTSMSVCIETINYLTEKLKSQESIIISAMNNKKADIYSIINQLHIIFYALSICLQRYRLVFSKKEDNQFEEEIIPPVIDLWRNQLKFEGVVVEENMHTREQRWLMILNNFTIIAAENLPQFTEKSRRLSSILI